MIKRDFFNRGGPIRQAMVLFQDDSAIKTPMSGLLRMKTSRKGVTPVDARAIVDFSS